MRRSILLLGGLLLLVDLLLVPKGCQYVGDLSQQRFEQMFSGCDVPPGHYAATATNASGPGTDRAE